MSLPRLLVPNRGEIAVRILSSARELGFHTIAVSTAGDDAHVSHAHEAVQLPSVSSYMDAALLVSLCQEHHVDFVHPAYGFLSESADFCKQLQVAGITFVGPGPDILQRTGDKLSARCLAVECGVPVLPALTEPVDNVDALEAFAQDVGLPLMIKAVDGGGGRGIRLVQDAKYLEPSFHRAVNESPSKKVFAEKAAVGGFRHIEVQILGDGQGNVRHFFERECSIQRRFQKIVEIAPSTILDRGLISSVIDAAVCMAKAINFKSLGTWEFLVSPENSAFYFMEINPRLQVEHTITEAICGIDLVRWQLLLASGKSFNDIGLDLQDHGMRTTPSSVAMQLRITAEDPHHNFSASIGRIREVLLPGGNGIRMDTHIRPGVTVSANFDSLLAKLIVVGFDWDSAVEKATRALEDVLVDGVTTNLSLLQAVVRSKDFRCRRFDTQWLEEHLTTMARNEQSSLRSTSRLNMEVGDGASPSSAKTLRSSDQLVNKGDRFNVQIEGHGMTEVFQDTVSVTSIMRNDFPYSLAVKLSPDSPSDSPSDAKRNQNYTLRLSKHSDLQLGAMGGQHSGTSVQTDPSQLVCPVAGQLVELLADNGHFVNEGDAVAIVRQMKMELEIRAHRSGTIESLFDIEEGEDVHVGIIICSIIPADRPKEKL